MLKIRYSAQFKKDYKRVKKQGRDIAKLAATLAALAAGEKLPERMRLQTSTRNFKKSNNPCISSKPSPASPLRPC